MKFNLHNKDRKTQENHTSLDRSCPSLQAMIDKYRQKEHTLLKWPKQTTPRSRQYRDIRRNIKRQTPIKCLQINLQHSRIATDNLMKLIEQEKSDIIFIQGPYLYEHRMTGITSAYSNYTSLEDNNRAAIVITNQNIDAVLISQLSDPDTVPLELDYNNTRFFTASMYFDITTDIDKELDKIDQILEFTKGNGLVIAVDSNSRSVAWHDTQTNKRGKTLEEYIISKSM